MSLSYLTWATLVAAVTSIAIATMSFAMTEAIKRGLVTNFLRFLVHLVERIIETAYALVARFNFGHNHDSSEPPALAEALVNLVTRKRYRDGVLVDLEEVFLKRLATGMSLRRARRLYWSDALGLILPRLWAVLKKIGLIGLVAKALSGH